METVTPLLLTGSEEPIAVVAVKSPPIDFGLLVVLSCSKLPVEDPLQISSSSAY
jgi:hypothetical protein